VAAGACNGAPNRTPTRLPSAETTYGRLAGGPAGAVHAGSPPTRTGVCPHPGGDEPVGTGCPVDGGGAGAAPGGRSSPVQPAATSVTAITATMRNLTP